MARHNQIVVKGEVDSCGKFQIFIFQIPDSTIQHCTWKSSCGHTGSMEQGVVRGPGMTLWLQNCRPSESSQLLQCGHHQRLGQVRTLRKPKPESRKQGGEKRRSMTCVVQSSISSCISPSHQSAILQGREFFVNGC